MNKKILVPLFLLSAGILASCGADPKKKDFSSEEPSSSDFTPTPSSGDSSDAGETSGTSIYVPDPDPAPTETYDIIFKDGEEVVAQYLDQIPGSYVDIPALDSKERYILTGWTGISDKAFKAGRVRVYETDQIYSAIWDERFGTSQKFDAVSLTSTSSITVDGTKDDAYLQAAEIDISSSSCAASAKAYVMYDLSNLYVFVEVTDGTKFPHKTANQNAFSCDSVGLYLDLMHNDSLATKPYTSGWGRPYRGEPGPMVEGMWKISRGFVATESQRYSDSEGSNFVFAGWLSNAAKEDGCHTVGTTYETAKGYNVEYRIDLTNSNIPDEYKPKTGNEFGLGIVLYDQTAENYDTNAPASSRCGIEPLNLEAESGPKKLSNFVYKQNATEDRTGIQAVNVRDCYSVSAESTRDVLFKDATAATIAGSTFETLYDDDNYHFYVTKGASAPSLKVAFDGMSETISIDGSKKFSVPNDKKYFTVTYQGTDGEVSEKYFIRNGSNSNNFDVARKLYTTKYTSTAIAVDGERDAAYDESVRFDVAYQSLPEKGILDATGVAYSMFDDSGLYVFVDVTDSDVDSTTENAPNPEQNDSVELWISTTQVLPTASTTWGNANRPDPDYCGEGCFRLRAGASTATGGHWLFDAKQYEVASKLTSTGYTAEFKVNWSSFAGNVKNGEIIDIMICINDGENGVANSWNRHGVVCANKYGHNSYLKPYYLDHIQLAGK